MEMEIVNYIKEARRHGLDDSTIKQNLLNAGWEAQAVEESFVHEKVMENPGAAVSQTPTEENLVHAMAMITKTTTSGLPSAQSIPQVQPQPISVPGILTEPATSAQLTALPPAKGKKKILEIAVIVAAAVILLGGGVYAYYTYGYNNPGRVWQKFLASGLQSAPQITTQFNFTYKDSLGAFTEEKPPFNNFSLNLSGKTYSDTSSSTNPTSSGSYSVAFNTDSGLNFDAGTDIILKDNTLYVNVASSTVLGQYFQKTFPGQTASWVKVDLKTAGTLAAASGSVFPDSQLGSQIKSIWSKAGVVSVKNYVGTDTVNGTGVFHFNNQIDKTALKNAINGTFDALANFEAQKNPSMKIDPVSTTMIKTVLGSTVDSLNIQNLQTWIGKSDARLYKISASTTMPSFLTSVGVTALASARAKARDAKREADMMQMSSALELYFNDFNGYPPADSNGQPTDLTPTYIGVLPTAPEPSDGTCSDYYNSYWYTPTGAKHVVNGKTVYDSYDFSFCVGGDIGAHKAGIAKLTPSGIIDTVACTGTAAQCSQQNNVSTSTPPTTAAISFDGTFSNYGKTQNVTVPADAVDIITLMGISTSTLDQSLNNSGL